MADEGADLSRPDQGSGKVRSVDRPSIARVIPAVQALQQYPPYGLVYLRLDTDRYRTTERQNDRKENG